MNRNFLLLIFIHWYPFLLVKSSVSFFNFDQNVFSTSHFINENFSIDAIFNLPSSYKCSYSQCLINLKLTLKNDQQLSMNLSCNSPSILIIQQYEKNNELSCVMNDIDGNVGSYRISGMVQVHTVGSFTPIFSAIFPNDPKSNQEWITKEIFILNSTVDEQLSSMKSPTMKRYKRQDININGANIQPIVNQDGSVHYDNIGQNQMIPVNDGINTLNQPIQLNIYSGTLNPGHTADLTCNGASACPKYPTTDDQGRAVCCFSLPQVSDGTTALSSVIYQNGAQDLNDFQVNVGNGQSFNAANDLSVFLGPIIPASQCNIILPAGTSQSTKAQFRITWTYHSNIANDNLPFPSIASLNDGTLPVNVLRVTSSSAFVQQRPEYNEWFVCPPSRDGQVSVLRSIALLSGNNIDYLRCIYVNNQGIPLKDPINGQLLVFSSTKNDALDNPSITTLPVVHTDCISIQFFPTFGASIDLNSILLSITVAFQIIPTTDMSSVMPQVSDLQGTFQIQIDITVNISPDDDNNGGNNAQTNVQISLPLTNDNLLNVPSIQCTRYQIDLPMSYDSSLGKYIGSFDIPSQSLQQTIIDSISVTDSLTVPDTIMMQFIDSQGNILSPPYGILSGSTLQNVPETSISKIIFQTSTLKDAAIDSNLHIDIVICPTNTSSTDSSLVAPSRSIPSPQTYNQGVNAVGSAPVSNSVPVQPLQSPSSISSDGTINCQERMSSTYGTYPPDLSALTIPTKKPPKIPKTQPTIGPDMYVTPPTPYQNINVQMLPDHICFDQISLTNNSFVYDILISDSDYTNSVDCLSPSSGCSINFINTKQPKITLLFTAPACISYLRILSPSTVQQFSYSMYDEDGIQIQLPGAVDNQGTLLSSFGTNPIVQLNQYSCGYSNIIQVLSTSDNGPPMRVTIDTGGCFKNLLATTTTIAPMLQPAAPSVLPSSWPQQVPPAAPAPSYMQPVVFAPSPTVPLLPSQPLSSPVAQEAPALAPLAQQSLPSSQVTQEAPASPPLTQQILPSSPLVQQPPPPSSPLAQQIPPSSPLAQQISPPPPLTQQAPLSPPVAQQPPPLIQSAPSPIMMPSQQPSQSVSTLPPSIAPAVALYCENNYQLIPLTSGSQCVSRIVTSDPTVVPNYSINPGNEGVNFQSNIPISIIYQFSCIVYIKYICITGTLSNVNKFSYVLSNVNEESVGERLVTLSTSDQCTSRPLPTAELVNQVVVIIEETTDGQPPRNLVVDIQGCISLSPSPAPSQIPSPPSSAPSQTQYIQAPPSSMSQPPQSPLPSAPVPIPLSPSLFENMRASPILSPPLLPQPPPLPPAILAASPPASFQTSLPSPVLQSTQQPLSASQPNSSAIFPSAPSPYQSIVASPMSAPPPSPSLSQPPAVIAPPVNTSPSSAAASPIAQQLPSPPAFQTILASPVLSPSSYSAFPPVISYPPSQTPIQPPTVPVQQYSPPVIYSSPIYQAPPIPLPPTSPQSLPSPIAPTNTNIKPLQPLLCTNNDPPIQLTLYNPCVSQIYTNDSNAIVDYNVNPGANGINFQSNTPVIITVQLKCSIQMMYMCIPGPMTNVGSFSYILRDVYNNPVASGSINSYGSDQCIPRPLNFMNPATLIVITISQTKDGQPPHNVVLDLQGCYVSPVSDIPTSPPFIAVTPPTMPGFWPSPNQPSSQFMAPAPPPVQVQPTVPFQAAPIPVPIQMVPPVPQMTPASSNQNTVTPVPSSSTNICPQVSLAGHPDVELIVFSDGTNVTKDLNPDGNGCNLVSTGTTMTVLLRDGMSATFSSVGVASPNVNQIGVALFDEQSNRPLIQSPQGIARSPITLNPSVQNLPMNPAATLAITFLSTVDGQPPQNVKLLAYACFPTVTEIAPSATSTSPSPIQSAQYSSQTSWTNTLNQQPYYPNNSSVQTYPSNQPHQYLSNGPTNVCVDPSQPAQVTSIMNTPLTPEYYSSNRCVCICQSGIVIPTSSGVIQYYPSSQTIQSSGQRRRKRHNILIKSKN